MTLALTEKGVANARADYRRDIPIRGQRGLILRVEPSRGNIRRTWRLRATLRGKSRVWTLGQYPGLRVADVRKLHADCIHAVEHGEDPQPIIERWHVSQIPEAQGSAAGPTVQDVIDEFLLVAGRTRKRPEAARKLLAANISEKLASTPVVALRKRHFVELFDRIVARGAPILATRVAADRDLIAAVPAMPRAPAGGEEKPRERVLDDKELVALWTGLDTLSPAKRRPKVGRPLVIALKILFLTAQRRGEVAAAKWSDITDESADVPGPDGKPTRITFKVWHIPTNKADRPHAIPLSPLACGLLEELHAINPEAQCWLPSKRTGDENPERDRSLTRAARTARECLNMADWTPHDLRRTARTGFARLGVPDAVAERILNHAAGDRMVAVYNRHSYLLEMRAALNSWSQRIEQLVAE
jgi:integrase